MDASPRRPRSFFAQAKALLIKNLVFQRRNMKTNIGMVAFPILLCLLLVLIQRVVDSALDKPELKCGCSCVDTMGDGKCQTVCGIQYSSPTQAAFCPIPNPQQWPPLLQVPLNYYRATWPNFYPVNDLPSQSCIWTESCPVTVLVTGQNRSFAESLGRNLFRSSQHINSSDYLDALSNFILGTYTRPPTTDFFEPAFEPGKVLFVLQPECPYDHEFTVPFQNGTVIIQKDVQCVPVLTLWCSSSSVVNDELFKGYIQGNTEGWTNQFLAAYDFLNSDENGFDARIWYNSSYNRGARGFAIALSRVPRSLNLASNTYLQLLRGSELEMRFEFVKEMPKPAAKFRLDFPSLLGALFFTWIIQLLFPVMLTYLVYEKQGKLKIIMKMHGLGDGPYWMISYAYFLLLSSFYMLCFVIFGSLIGLKFFTLNDYNIQFVFYFIYINLQIALAFLVANIFTDVKTATVVAYIYVFGSGLLGANLFQLFVQDSSLRRVWVLAMEIVPGFSLYRGLYEFSQYTILGDQIGSPGMRWEDLNDRENGMKDVWIIMVVEWLTLLPLAYYLDQAASLGCPIKKYILFSMKIFQQKPSIFVGTERPDVSQEREKVQQLLQVTRTGYAIISDNIMKVYPGKDGNPKKFAVRGLSLALPRGECFGLLGPNGAGKTSFINMMIGLIKPTSGTAYVDGLDIQSEMHEIYTRMGVCPQHDLLWESLTGREHLLFYGRLKSLKGAALRQAVNESLKNVNLYYGGVGDKPAGKYSGGMKRRLSVAISLIGDPKVVYMDEPSTGLDPASRSKLWDVIKRAKQNRAIILTTHSMEEAEVLCDRLGIFVDGSLQYIGNPRELKARFGGSFVFTITTSPDKEQEVERLVRHFSPSAKKIYHLSGTQKFELWKQEARIADVCQAVEYAKSRFDVYAWGLADTTLEDVFIKVAKETESFDQQLS